jgi:hypothetical protein
MRSLHCMTPKASRETICSWGMSYHTSNLNAPVTLPLRPSEHVVPGRAPRTLHFGFTLVRRADLFRAGHGVRWTASQRFSHTIKLLRLSATDWVHRAHGYRVVSEPLQLLDIFLETGYLSLQISSRGLLPSQEHDKCAVLLDRNPAEVA